MLSTSSQPGKRLLLNVFIFIYIFNLEIGSKYQSELCSGSSPSIACCSNFIWYTCGEKTQKVLAFERLIKFNL